MRKLLFFLVALFVTLGVSAQTTTPDSNGYFDFASEYLGMEECTESTVFTDGMLIAIQHSHGVSGHEGEGHFLEIYSKEESGVHKMRMFEKCHGLSALTLVKDGDGFKLQTILEGHFVGELDERYGNTRTSKSYPGVYNFTWRDEFGGFSVDCGNGKSLCVNASAGTVELCGSAYNGGTTAQEHQIFKIYKLSQPNGITGYVENAKVTLIGPNGNKFETVHSGWSDFFEFLVETENKSGNLYGLTVSNVKYNRPTNEITGNVIFPFSVSGDDFTIPVHLYTQLNGASYKDDTYRVAAVAADGADLTVATKPNDGWVKDQKNQWAIIPTFGEMSVTYAIKNLATGKYLNTDPNLGDTPAAFSLSGKTVNDEVVAYRFACKKNSSTYYIKATSDGKVSLSTWSGDTGVNFWVPNVSSAELDGVPAKGFTRYYKDDLFWDEGKIDPSKAPMSVQENLNSSHPEHELYCARTSMRIPQPGTVTVTFGHDGGHQLAILGVDIIDAQGNVKYSDYHVGEAGNSGNNVYTMTDVVLGSDYSLRYWVCRGSDESHDLTQARGSIVVTGADYYLKYSNAPLDGKWSANTTWFRMRLYDRCERYISAQPAYMDDNNHLKLTNNTPPSDNAGLWAVIGDEENGYKFYNRAWGPKYALTTTGYESGDGGSARTYMVPADSAVTYDIKQVPNSYKFSVKMHDTDNAYFNYRGGYLGIWNSGDALGEANSIMTFETVNMEGWDEQTEVLMNNIKKRWRPWVAEPEIGTAYYYVIEDADFAFMMQNRLSIFIGLHKKVFKFANIDTASSDRTGKILAVKDDGKVGGIAATESIRDYVQLFHNGNGTFKLYHPQSGKYLMTPDNAKATASVDSAANFTYDMYGDEEGIVAFTTGGQTIHLKNTEPFDVMSYGISDPASRWNVSYSQEAQDLVETIATARERYAALQDAAYQANLGVPGYAGAATVGALNDSITAALAATDFVAAKAMVEEAMQAITAEENAPLFPIDCYFTITNKNGRGSVVYDNSVDKPVDTANGNAAYLWHNTSVDAANVNHLWGFYYNPIKEEYYLYNVGAQQFANPAGLGVEGKTRYGGQGDTWIFSDIPVAISLTDLGDKYFHIQGGSKTMSISTSYKGSVITYYAKDDPGVPFKFDKSAKEFDEELYKEMEKKVVRAGLTYVTDLAKLGNAAIYGISTARGPLAYISGTEGALSTPKNSATDVEANAIENAHEQFAILRTENTPEGKYYLYNLSKQRFVNTGAAFAENPVAITSFSATGNATYPWFVWLGDNERININASGLLMRTANQAKPDEGNRFRIQYVKTDAEATEAALEAIIALETAVAEAQAFLDNTPKTVGYPVEATRAEFQSAIDARASVTAIADAKTAFVAATDVVMPENGKAYKINAWWRNRTWPLTFIEDKPVGYACQTPAYVPVENAEPAVFVCREVAEGEYAFITDNGYYFGWQAADKGNNTSKDYQVTNNGKLTPNKFKLVKAVVANNGAGPKLNNEDVFGKFNLYGQRDNAWWHYMFSCSSKNFHDSGSGIGAGKAFYGDDAHTVYYTLEEVSTYTLNQVKLTPTSKEKDTLLKGIEDGQTIGTFSAPYATMIPEGVKAYYAKEAEQEGSLYLKPVESGVLPAQEGVILVGELGEGGQAVTLASMLPVAGEQVVAISNNEFANSAMGDVVIGDYDYILANGSEGIGIYKAKHGTKLKQGKAYLSFVSATAARSFVMNFGSVATDVETTLTESALENTIYDLSGRRVNEVTKGGIYIVNGKKVFIK